MQTVADAVVGPGLTRGLLVVASLLALLVAAALLLRQRDLKRMLAYSSLEHMGLLALAAAIGGPLALAAALLHVLCHGLAKASAFVTAGRIVELEGTSAITDVRGLLARRPGVAVPFLVSIVALLGFPPFGLFFSEVAILVAGVRAGMVWQTAAAAALVLVALAAVARHCSRMLLGGGAGSPARDRDAHGPRAPLVMALSATAVVGFLGGGVAALLVTAAGALGGAS